MCWSFLGVLGGPFAGPFPFEDFIISWETRPTIKKLSSNLNLLARDAQRANQICCDYGGEGQGIRRHLISYEYHLKHKAWITKLMSLDVNKEYLEEAIRPDSRRDP